MCAFHVCRVELGWCYLHVQHLAEALIHSDLQKCLGVYLENKHVFMPGQVTLRLKMPPI